MTTARTALVVTVDGTVTLVEFPAPADTLAFLQEHVEGNFDVVSLAPYLDMWVNDEGIFTHNMNPVATLIAHGFGMTHQPYHGPAVFTGGVDDDGNTLPLDPGVAIALQGIAEHLSLSA